MITFDFERINMSSQIDAALDNEVLGRILAVGDAETSRRLHKQIMADLERLQAALGPAGSASMIAAHELKGLAATIGAHRLARLAEALQQGPEAGDPDLQHRVLDEIATVLALLSQREGGQVTP